MQSIHCKVSLDDQYRRFLFKFSTAATLSSEGGEVESQFKKLQHQVRTLYGFGGDFVLKYKDDESDLIIIECDEELNCAVAQSAGLLRLFIELKDEPMTDATSTKTTTTTTTTPTTTTTVASPTSALPSENTCPYHYGRYGHHGRGGRHGRGGNGHWHGRHGNGYGHGHGHGFHGHGKHHGRRGSCGGKFNVEKLTSKREFIAAVLNDPQVNVDEFKKLKLQRKLECIDRRLAIANSMDQQEASDVSSSSSGDDKWRKKKCDKYRRNYHGKCNRSRKIRRNLTEDEKAVLQVLKTQIWELKPTLNTIKIQLCEKKALKADANNKGDVQRVEELKKEIQQLKELKKEHKNAIAPLKSQIFAMKFDKEC